MTSVNLCILRHHMMIGATRWKLPGRLKVPSTAGNIATMGVSAAKKLPLPFSMNVGGVTVEAVFREATSNRIDAVVANRAQGSRVLKSKPWSTLADVEASLAKWAKDFRKAVDKAHGR